MNPIASFLDTKPAHYVHEQILADLQTATPEQRQVMAATYIDALEAVGGADSKAERLTALQRIGRTGGEFGKRLAVLTDDAPALVLAGAMAFSGYVMPRVQISIAREWGNASEKLFT